MKIKNTLVLLLAVIIVLLSACTARTENKTQGRTQKVPHDVDQTASKPVYVREPAVAGAFYEGNPVKLRAMVEKFISEAEISDTPGTVIGYVSPHAGYIYSGPVAGYVYKPLQGKKFKTVIVLAPSHRAQFPGVSVIPSGVYRTPLGDVPVDEETVAKLMKYNPSLFKFYPDADKLEHSLEVQVPFLQVALQEGWKIVPIVYGQHDFGTSSRVAEAIASVYHPNEIMIIASSDMSHYHPYEEAKKMDKRTLDLIAEMNIEEVITRFDSRTSEMCGHGPVQTLLVMTSVFQGKAKVLNYATSGDTAGSKQEVVGYGAVAFYTDKKIERKTDVAVNTEETDSVTKEKPDFDVTDEQKKMLMTMARKTIEEYVETGKTPTFDYNDPILEKELGLFVTLRKEPGKMLRGCIGHCFPVMKLKNAVTELAISSATQDPRFPPVRKNELKDISIEISLLSPMRKVDHWEEIRVPGHGVYVKKGYRAGVFLPQVADETGWDRETFMSCLCREKAGLHAGAWKEADTDLFVFTVVKFEEEDVMKK